MDRKSICSLLCAMMLAILLISCNDKDDYDGLSPAELSGTYSNKLSAPANGDSLILSYNGNTFIGKDVEFKTDDGKTAHIILKYVLPHDTETAIPGISLTAGSGSYSGTVGHHDSREPADNERYLVCRPRKCLLLQCRQWQHADDDRNAV